MKYWKKHPISAIVLSSVVLLIAVVGIWLCLRDSDEHAVRRQIEALCRIAEKSNGEKVLSGALKINQTGNVFAPQCKIQFVYEMFSGTFTPRELTANLARYRSLFRSAKIKADDVEVKLTAPDRADVSFFGQFNGETKDGKTVAEVKDLTCSLRKIDGIWLVEQITMREVIEK